MSKAVTSAVVALLGFLALAHAAQVISPAYYYPGTLWTQTTQAGSKVAIMVANANNGPGTAVDTNYRNAIAAAQAKGVKVVGYVHLSYATRAQSAVTADIAKWYSFYPTIDGIFFDECPAGTSGVSYVSAMSAVVKKYSKNTLILNPGIYPAQGYMPLADHILAFEGTYASYTKLVVPSWVTSYAASKFYHIVHTCPAANFANALKLAGNFRAQYVFMTDDLMPNPYDKLPTYWTTQLAAMTASTTTTPCTCTAEVPTIEEVPTPEELAFNQDLVEQLAQIDAQQFSSGSTSTSSEEAPAAAQAVDSFEIA